MRTAPGAVTPEKKPPSMTGIQRLEQARLELVLLFILFKRRGWLGSGRTA